MRGTGSRKQMEFTYDAYKNMILLLKEHGYAFSGYHDYRKYTKNVIVRHDIDIDLEKALIFSKLEYEMGISATYFVLVTGDFYNVSSRGGKKLLKSICDNGHSIGLHFDETQYDKTDENWWSTAVDREISLLEQCTKKKVTAVSMHRPSKNTLKENWNIRNGEVANSYGKEFFEDHKYLSDSRRNWREDVLDIINKEQYDRLHILVHPFWYHTSEKTAKEVLSSFCRRQVYRCYDELSGNIRNLDELLEKCELL